MYSHHESVKYSNINNNNNNNNKKSPFAAFNKIRAQYPAIKFGNRCGHTPQFSKLLKLKKNGKSLKIPHFLQRVEHQIFMLFRQHYKIIFAQCPQLAAAAAGEHIRSETREALYIVATMISRNIDLTTMRCARSRTATEIARFANHALTHDSRRLSPERFFDAIRLLTDAGLLYYRIPGAVRNGEKWQAAPAEIAFTEQLWNLLGISKTERLQQRNKARHAATKRISAADQVAQRRFQRRLQKETRRERAAAATARPVNPPPAANSPDADADFRVVHDLFNKLIGDAYAAQNAARAELLQSKYNELISDPHALADVARQLRQ